MDVVYSPLHRNHDAAEQVEYGQRLAMNECPERGEDIHRALRADPQFEFHVPAEHGVEPITAVHDPALIAYLETAWSHYRAALGPTGDTILDAVADTYRHPGMFEGMPAPKEPVSPLGKLGYWCFDTTTPIVEGTFVAARAAVDVAVSATDLVLNGARSAYGLCRPPGHHAPRAAFGGYCYFNNAAISAQRAIESGAARVTILDVDYHHGNGSQQWFWARGDVQYVSLHGDPARAYPYFCGFADEVGTGAGFGANMNIPLDEGCTDAEYLNALNRACDVIQQFGPSVIVVSLGVDTFHNDPLGDLALTTDSFRAQGTRIADLGVPMVVIQEGGYDVTAIGANVRSFLCGI